MADDRNRNDRYNNEDEEYNERNEEEVDNEEEDEEDYEEVEGSGKGTLTGFLILFIILFVAAAGLLTYFQFIKPDGSFELSFKKRQVSGKKVEKLEANNQQLQQAVDSLKAANQQKLALVDSLRNSGSGSSGNSGNNKGGAAISGTYYSVQIGAFESFSFERYGDKVTNLSFREENGVLKLTLGRFKEANAARAFRRDLVEIGIEDAFIAKMKNGKRVDIIESY